MTPFDPTALLVMLLTFYPVVTPANLQRARTERPEYFSGGILFGSKGDKLRLPDRREWDLIVASGGPVSGRRWQVLFIDPNAPVVDDPFALEDGPLTPIDEQATLPPLEDHTFELLAAQHLEELGAVDGQLHRAAQTIIESDGATRIDAAYEQHIVPARAFHDATRRALDTIDPADVLEQTQAHGSLIEDGSGRYNEEPPPDLPDNLPGDMPDEGTPPQGGGEPPK